MWLWVDPIDQDIIDQVAPGGTYDEAQVAIATASNMLMVLTGYLVHPEGTAVEDYRAEPATIRLTPTYRPLVSLTSVVRLHYDSCSEVTDITDQFCIRGGNIRLKDERPFRYHGYSYYRLCVCGTCGENLRVTYGFGSTVGPMGRRTVVALAHQLWLAENPAAGECQLPERVVSVSREGVTWTVLDSMQYLDHGRLGFPPVDQYLATVNPSKGRRPSAVYTPDSPPGVGVAGVLVTP